MQTHTRPNIIAGNSFSKSIQALYHRFPAVQQKHFLNRQQKLFALGLSRFGPGLLEDLGGMAGPDQNDNAAGNRYGFGRLVGPNAVGQRPMPFAFSEPDLDPLNPLGVV